MRSQMAVSSGMSCSTTRMEQPVCCCTRMQQRAHRLGLALGHAARGLVEQQDARAPGPARRPARRCGGSRSTARRPASPGRRRGPSSRPAPRPSPPRRLRSRAKPAGAVPPPPCRASAGGAPGPPRSSRPRSGTGTAAPLGRSGPTRPRRACGPARCRCRHRPGGSARRRAGRNPETQSKKVVLPAPLWPMSPRISPSRSVRLMSSMAVMPPKVLRTPLHSRIAGASAEGGTRLPGSATTSAEEALAWTWRSDGPASGVTTVPSTEPAPAMKTERRMSGRSSRSPVRPLKRTSPFSRKTARSASSSATLTDCSTTTIVVPVVVQQLDHLEELRHHGRGQAERELVDHEHLGRHHERHGQREHLLLAAGEVARLLVAPLAQNREEVEHPRPWPRPRRGGPCGSSRCPGAGSPPP